MWIVAKPEFYFSLIIFREINLHCVCMYRFREKANSWFHVILDTFARARFSHYGKMKNLLSPHKYFVKLTLLVISSLETVVSQNFCQKSLWISAASILWFGKALKNVSWNQMTKTTNWIELQVTIHRNTVRLNIRSN